VNPSLGIGELREQLVDDGARDSIGLGERGLTRGSDRDYARKLGLEHQFFKQARLTQAFTALDQQRTARRHLAFEVLPDASLLAPPSNQRGSGKIRLGDAQVLGRRKICDGTRPVHDFSVKGVSHWVVDTAPDLLTAMILEQLASVTAPGN
jgi:hypothetical protein